MLNLKQDKLTFENFNLALNTAENIGRSYLDRLFYCPLKMFLIVNCGRFFTFNLRKLIVRYSQTVDTDKCV